MSLCWECMWMYHGVAETEMLRRLNLRGAEPEAIVLVQMGDPCSFELLCQADSIGHQMISAMLHAAEY